MQQRLLLGVMLGWIPGLGHLLIGRVGRGFVYGLGVFGLLGFGVFLSSDSQNGAAFFGMAVLAVVVWVINLIDLWRYAFRNSGARATATVDSGETADSPQSAVDSHERFTAAESHERFATALLSVVPGLGHFHMGLMNRGLTLLLSFVGWTIMTIFLTILTQEPALLLFLGALPILWLYNIFDAMKLIGMKQRGEQVLDRSLFEEWEQQREEGRRSKVMAMLLSLFPGAGHLYLGLQRRGLQLMGAFLFSIYILDSLRLSLFFFLIPLIWCYSFFDALQQVSRWSRRPEEMQDIPLVDKVLNHQRWLGIALLALGLYYVADRFLLDWLNREFPQAMIPYYFRQYTQTAVVSVLLIGGGLRLLLGSKRQRSDPL